MRKMRKIRVGMQGMRCGCEWKCGKCGVSGWRERNQGGNISMAVEMK